MVDPFPGVRGAIMILWEAVLSKVKLAKTGSWRGISESRTRLDCPNSREIDSRD